MRFSLRLFFHAKNTCFDNQYFWDFGKFQFFGDNFDKKSCQDFFLNWDKNLMGFKSMFDIFFGIGVTFFHPHNYNISKDTLAKLITCLGCKIKAYPNVNHYLHVFVHNFHAKWQTHWKKFSVKVWLILLQIFFSKIGDRLSVDHRFFIRHCFFFIIKDILCWKGSLMCGTIKCWATSCANCLHPNVLWMRHMCHLQYLIIIPLLS